MGRRKKDTLRTVTIIIASLLFLVGTIAVRYARTFHDQSRMNAQKNVWVRQVKIHGAVASHEKLKRMYRTDKDRRHWHAHLLGQALYKTIGMPGIVNCDNAFGYGCFHGFVTLAITGHGPNIIQLLDEVCIRSFGVDKQGCQHGIGHGIAEFFGTGRLQYALDACKTLSWKGRLGGCQSGLLMAYHFPVINGRMTVRRTDDLYDPCSRINEKFQLACIHELTFWWSALFMKETVKMATLCDRFSDKNERRVCFWGIGQFTFRIFDYNVSDVVTACSVMPEPEDEALCRAGARFLQIDDQKSLGIDICAGLGNVKNICYQYTDLISFYRE